LKAWHVAASASLSSFAGLQDAWCKFDIIVVAVSIIGVGIDLGTPSNLQFLPLIRVLRVVRIFRLVPKAEGLRVLLRTLLMSLPGVNYMTLLAAHKLCQLAGCGSPIRLSIFLVPGSTSLPIFLPFKIALCNVA